MSNLENANSPAPVSPPPLRTWDFMETALVTLIAYGVFALTSGITLAVMLAMPDGADKLSPVQLQALAMQGRLYGTALIIASPPTIAVLWIAIRMARREFAEYLALNWPSRDELMRALAVAAVLVVAEIVLRSGGSAEGSVSNPYLSVKGAAGLLALLIGGCIAAPIMEEFVVRGFMFRGWSQSFLGPIGAIVLTSALWAMNHTQYDWVERFWIFILGLALGHFRWRSNSTWLTVMVHSTINTFVFFTMGPYT
jgi:membrane protease YdiL (CAAX protease family)